MAPGAAPTTSPRASLGGDGDAASAIEPGASKAQVKMVTHGHVSRLCVGQQERCAQLRLQRGKSSLCQSQGEKGDFFFLTSFGVLISIFGNVYPLL